MTKLEEGVKKVTTIKSEKLQTSSTNTTGNYSEGELHNVLGEKLLRTIIIRS